MSCIQYGSGYRGLTRNSSYLWTTPRNPGSRLLGLGIRGTESEEEALEVMSQHPNRTAVPGGLLRL